MITNLTARLALWEKNGVIDHSTSARIIEFERSRNTRSWVVFGIAGVGITALISGIVSLIAANWAGISAPVKIAAYFALQLGVGALFIKQERKEGLWREATLTVFALLFWAGIGLFSQIYHLEGETWQAMLLWAALALPATLYAESRMLCALWCITLLCAAGFYASSDYTPSHLYHWATPFARGCIAATVPVLLSALAIFGHYHGFIREHLRRAAIEWGIGSVMLIGVPVANTWWNSANFLHSEGEPVWFILIPWCAVAWAIIVSLSRTSLSAALRNSTAAMFLAAAIYLTIPALCDVGYLLPKPLNQVFGAAGFLVVWGFAAAAAAFASMKRPFDFASFVMALRFVIIYFVVFGSLTTTDIGLIISGGVIIAIAIYWNKLRVIVTKSLGGGI